MINKENEVFTRVREAIVAEFPNADVDSSYQPVPSKFPHVSLYMSDTYVPNDAMDSSLEPEYMVSTFEVNVYSNASSGKKQEAKKIMGIIFNTMYEMNFRMIVCSPVPNLNDSSIYRQTARFEGMADSNNFYSR
jgi:hypothetical protein